MDNAVTVVALHTHTHTHTSNFINNKGYKAFIIDGIKKQAILCEIYIAKIACLFVLKNFQIVLLRLVKE